VGRSVIVRGGGVTCRPGGGENKKTRGDTICQKENLDGGEKNRAGGRFRQDGESDRGAGDVSVKGEENGRGGLEKRELARRIKRGPCGDWEKRKQSKTGGGGEKA